MTRDDQRVYGRVKGLCVEGFDVIESTITALKEMKYKSTTVEGRCDRFRFQLNVVKSKK